MSSEIGFNSMDDEFDRYYRGSFSNPTSPTSSFSEAMPYAVQAGVDERIQKVARNRVHPMEAGGSVEVKIEASWGGKGGPGVSIGASGEIHDDNGNYAKGEIKQDRSGEGGASISAGHKEEEKGG